MNDDVNSWSYIEMAILWRTFAVSTLIDLVSYLGQNQPQVQVHLSRKMSFPGAGSNLKSTFR